MSHTSDAPTDREALRRQRLIQELRDEGVRLVEDIDRAVIVDDESFGAHLRRGLAENDGELLETLLVDELYYARYAPVHEQRTASYGSIILLSEYDNASLLDATLVPVASNGYLSVPEARRFADGLSTFLVRRPGGHTSIAVVNGRSERELVDLAESTYGWVVQRHPAGAIRVYGRERVLQYMNNEWTIRPYAHTRWINLADKVDELLGADADERLLAGAALLDFCLHTLSARRVGATLVWFPKNLPSSPNPGLSKQWVPLPVELTILSGDHLQVLATLLASVDGACVVHRASVIGAEAQLQYSRDAEEAVHPMSGTRHTSAARFSYDVRDAVIFVVSSDGPVSVFFGGTKIDSLTNSALPPVPDDFLSRR